MKRTELASSVLLVPLDFFLLLAAAWAAYYLRFQETVTDFRPVLYDFSSSDYLQAAAVVALGWVVIFAFLGLYNRRATDSWWSEVGQIILGCATGLLSVIVVVFFRREFFSSRFVLLAAAGLAVIFISLGRLIIRQLQHTLFSHGYGAHRVLIIGTNATANDIAERMRQIRKLGYSIFRQLPADTASLKEVSDLADADSFDELLFVDPAAPAELRQQFLEVAEYHHCIFRYAPDLLQSPVGPLMVSLDLGIPVVEVPETTMLGWGRVFKRLFDIVFSLFALVIFSPVLFCIAIFVRLDSRGPAIFWSERVGPGRRFTFYKFRTMKFEYCLGEAFGGKSADEYYEQLISTQSARVGPVPKIINDPRLTRTGGWLRRWSLDELPQLWNVLRGDMSLVGPRPHLPRDVERYMKHHRKVLAIKPGLTGLAQVSGRSDLDFEDEVRLDRYYIEHWSFWLDLRILMKTVVAVLAPRRTL